MASDEPIRPDYDGACLSRVIPALLGGREESWLPEPVRGARALVLLVLDGLGWTSVEHASLPGLGLMEGGPITTVIPSSTPSALTSLTTGLPPSEHGMVGIHIPVDGVMLHTIRWTSPGRGVVPAPARVQPRAPFGGRPVPVVTRAEFEGSGFTEAHLRGARMVGWRTTAMLLYRCRELIGEGEPFVYAYYDGIDTVAHAVGIDNAMHGAEVDFADRLVAELLGSFPSDVALVVTADHGQVGVGAEDWIELDAVEHLVRAYAGDPRCRSLYARDAAAAELLAAASETYGARAWVLARERALDERWFGPPTPEVAERIGDVILLAREGAFADPANRGEQRLRSVHGSATRAEMLVPLLAARGRA